MEKALKWADAFVIQFSPKEGKSMAYTKENARILYMGTPEISASVLEGLLEEGFNVVAVVTNPDKEVGRKRILTPPPVKQVALAHSIPVYQPRRIRLEHEFLSSLDIDVIVTMAYGQIVPKEVLEAPKRGCINLHGSLLPELRGAAPIQRALDLGYKATGVTLMQMVEAMDAGEMYDKEIVPIEEKDNYTDLAKKISASAKRLILRDLLPYLNGGLPGIPQDESKVTFAAKISKEEEHLDLSLPAEQVRNHIRALSLTPGAYVELPQGKCKILQAEVAEGKSLAQGELCLEKSGAYLGCGAGVLKLLEVQLEGKNKMEGNSFSNGYRSLHGYIVK